MSYLIKDWKNALQIGSEQSSWQGRKFKTSRTLLNIGAEQKWISPIKTFYLRKKAQSWLLSRVPPVSWEDRAGVSLIFAKAAAWNQFIQMIYYKVYTLLMQEFCLYMCISAKDGSFPNYTWERVCQWTADCNVKVNICWVVHLWAHQVHASPQKTRF